MSRRNCLAWNTVRVVTGGLVVAVVLSACGSSADPATSAESSVAVVTSAPVTSTSAPTSTKAPTTSVPTPSPSVVEPAADLRSPEALALITEWVGASFVKAGLPPFTPAQQDCVGTAFSELSDADLTLVGAAATANAPAPPTLSPEGETALDSGLAACIGIKTDETSAGFTMSGEASFLPMVTSTPGAPSVDPCSLLAGFTAPGWDNLKPGSPNITSGLYASGTSCRFKIGPDEEVTVTVFDGVDPAQVAAGQAARGEQWTGLGDDAYYAWVDGLSLISGTTLVTVRIMGATGPSDDEDLYRSLGAHLRPQLG